MVPRSRHLPLTIGLFLLLYMLLALSSGTQAASVEFADGTFRQIWERTDAPVASGKVQRSWYWGPEPGQTRQEPYAGGKGGTRLVQYFDKARMEINNPDGDRKSEWFVTTGLLVAEMVAGKQQVGDRELKPTRPAEIAVAGDGLSTDPDAPSYTSFRPMASITVPGANRAPNRTGQAATATVDRAGRVGDNTALGLYPGVKLAAYEPNLGHNIPQAMWDFLNLKGTVQRDGKAVEGQTLANWVYVMGYPITEPYWARVKVEGVLQDALIQLYERRSLVYVPAFPKGWQVQMGNVGQHYYRWLYGGPLPAPLVPLATNQADLPPSVDATISPQVAEVGTLLSVTISGFSPGEEIVSWFTGPDGATADTRSILIAGPDGTVSGISIPTRGMQPGKWAVTYHGRQSSHESIAYFLLTAPRPTATPQRQATAPSTPGAAPSATATRPRPPIPGSPNPSATVPVVPTEPAGGLVLSVRPGAGAPGDQFTFSARGLAPNEPVQVKFTDPDNAVVYPADSNGGQYTASDRGRLEITLRPDQAFPATPLGVWLFEVKGQRSGLEGVVGFTLR